MLHTIAERVHAHARTVVVRRTDPARPRTRTNAPSSSPVTERKAVGQWTVIDGMRMLFARAARAALARSQSGSLVRRTKELCASHSAVHDVHARRYEPPE
jgi:hypothetical protein